ncbi:MAG: TIGR03013 family PEP-CTERM/XrtA system glycosyltransferase [Deltaproteobacteria bacterium]|nr:TIGR03013 family PEP-CTERM/XrtA system glycosyltransferase [Deltaproteobacteria bacterium]
MRILRQYVSNRELVFILGEGLLIFGAVFLASSFFGLPRMSLFERLLVIWPKALLVAFVAQFSLYFNDLYEIRVSESTLDLATHLIQAIGMTSVTLAVIYFVWPEAIIGRWVFFLSLVFLIGFLVSWRLLYNVAIRRRMFTSKTLIVGAGELAGDLLKAVNQRKDLSYDIRGILYHPGETPVIGEDQGIPIRLGFDGLCDLAEAEEASSIIVALDDKRGIMPYHELLSCKVRGLSVIDGESFYERITGKLLVEKINPGWLIFSEGFRKSAFSRFLKRLAGLVMATVMLILLSPVMVLVAVAIKLDSRGRVIFSQERVGENGGIFMLHKFRSMRADAEEATGPVWAAEDDPRVTRVGRIIRKLRIDELPQLWNILNGEMSFVGPRPERPFFVERLRRTVPYYEERFTVKPGLTGWAQVMYAYGATEEDALEKLRYDLYYIKNMSLVLDLIVIFHTVKIVLLGRGSR